MTTTHVSIGPEPINKSEAFCAFAENVQSVITTFNVNRENNPFAMAFMSSRPFCIVGKLISFDAQVAKEIAAKKQQLKPDDFANYLEQLFRASDADPFTMQTQYAQ